MRRTSTRLLTLLVISTLALVVQATPAFASCGDTRTWGTVVTNNGTDNSGTRDYIYVHPATVVDYTGYGYPGHINETLWEATANSYDLNNAWVEVGYTKGWEFTNQLTWYWADNRVGYGGFEHKINIAIDVNTWHHLKIKWTGNRTWTVYIDNNSRGVSTDNGINSDAMEAGLESTSECNSLGTQASPGYADNLEYLKPNGTWTSQWQSNTQLYSPGSAQVEWVTQLQDSHNWLS